MAPGLGPPSDTDAGQVVETGLEFYGTGGSLMRGVACGLGPGGTVLLNCEEFCATGGACCAVPDGRAAEKNSDSWRSA
jgi:hypothetical protein